MSAVYAVSADLSTRLGVRSGKTAIVTVGRLPVLWGHRPVDSADTAYTALPLLALRGRFSTALCPSPEPKKGLIYLPVRIILAVTPLSTPASPLGARIRRDLRRELAESPAASADSLRPMGDHARDRHLIRDAGAPARQRGGETMGAPRPAGGMACGSLAWRRIRPASAAAWCAKPTPSANAAPETPRLRQRRLERPVSYACNLGRSNRRKIREVSGRRKPDRAVLQARSRNQPASRSLRGLA